MQATTKCVTFLKYVSNKFVFFNYHVKILKMAPGPIFLISKVYRNSLLKLKMQSFSIHPHADAKLGEVSQSKNISGASL